ncbi:MAG: YdbL family protein [Amphritea sp.]|nr:YdbL family protein [Amphritea sp.]
MNKRLKNTLKTITRILTLATLLFSVSFSSAWAISLDEAKNRGMVGEQLNGYLGVVQSSGEARSLADSINKKRRAAYAEKARKAGVDINVIEIRIGERLIQRATKGHYIQNSNGQWSKK